MKQGWLNKMQSTCFRRQITRWDRKHQTLTKSSPAGWTEL